MNRRVYEWIVPIGYALVAILTFRHYGITLDESKQMRYGELVLEYFRSGFASAGGTRFLDLRFYGPLFEAISAAAWQFAPSLKFEIHHLCIAATALATIIATGRFAKYVDADPFLAQLALVALPQFYGHSFNNSKDIPFACAVTWSFVALARLGQTSEQSEAGARAGWKPALFVGVAVGATMAIRAGGAMLLVLAALVVIATAKRRRPILLRLAVAAVLAWIIMIAVWPWALQDPIRNPVTAIRLATSFSRTTVVLFQGQFLRSDALPRRYLVEMLAITTPLPLLAFSVAGFAIAAWRARRIAQALLVTWIVVPLVAFVIIRPNVYDGIRHFLFLMPALAIATSIAATELVRRWPRVPVRVAVVLLIALSFVPMWRLHPYEMTYYNAVVGGTRGAAARFDTDYWTSSYREAALWLRERSCPGRPIRVLVAANPFWIDSLRAYLPPDRFALAETMDLGVKGEVPQAFDYYVATTRWGFAANYNATPVIHAVGRDGAVFTVIRGRKVPC